MENRAIIFAQDFRAREARDALAWVVRRNFPSPNSNNTITRPISRPVNWSPFWSAGLSIGVFLGAVNPNQRIERGLRLGIAG